MFLCARVASDVEDREDAFLVEMQGNQEKADILDKKRPIFGSVYSEERAERRERGSR